MQANKKKAIIFDMDNTLLRSKINFAQMRATAHRLLTQAGIAADSRFPTSVMLQKAADDPRYTPALHTEIWAHINAIEAEGMEKAVLEPGVLPAMQRLSQNFTMMIFTNNLQKNVEGVLADFGLRPYFLQVAGRDKVKNLKPQPDGYLYLQSFCPGLTPKDFLAIGDASIDFEAALACDMAFVAYNNSRQEDWSRFACQPLAFLHTWDAAACETIENILGI